MSILDKYFTSKDVDYNGNDLTIHVGTLTIDGNVSVTGSFPFLPAEDNGISVDDSGDLIISCDNNWFFRNDGLDFFHYSDSDDGYDSIVMGDNYLGNISKLSVSGSQYYYGNINTYGEREGFNSEGTVATLFVENGTAGQYASAISTSLKEKSLFYLKNSDVFLSMSAGGVFAGKICGAQNGVSLNGVQRLELSAPNEIEITSPKTKIHNDIININNDSGLATQGNVPVSTESWFHPLEKTVCWLEYNRIFIGTANDSMLDIGSRGDSLYYDNSPDNAAKNDVRMVFSILKLPSHITPSNGKRIISIQTMWSPGSDESINNYEDVLIPGGDWFGSSTGLNKEGGNGLVWHLKYDYQASTPVYYLSLMMNVQIGETEQRVLKRDSLSDGGNAYLDLAIRITYIDEP
jgi:hypothetical protein